MYGRSLAALAALSLWVTAFAGTHSDTGLTVREETAALYTWIGPAVGDWADPANWRPSEAGTFAIPSNAAARVEFPAGEWTVRGGGASFSVSNLTFAARASVTLANMTLVYFDPQAALVGGESADLRLDAARIVLADKAAMGFGKYGSTTLANSTVVDGNMLIKLYYDPLLRVCGGRSIINGALTWKSDKNAKNRFDIHIDDADLVVRGLFEFGNASDVVGGIRPVLALTNGTLQADSWTAVTPFTVDLTVPSGGFATAPIAVLYQANLATNLTFRIDATACSVNGTYPLVEALSIQMPADGIDAFALDCLTAPGCTAQLVAETVERGNVPEAVGRIALKISGGTDPIVGGQPVLTVPRDGETVTMMSEARRAYYALPMDGRHSVLLTFRTAARDHLHVEAFDRTYAPLLKWTGTVGPCTVVVTRVADGREVLREVSSNGQVSALTVFSGESYTWRVTSADGRTASGSFTTEATAPRILRGSLGANNVRDLGGWTGLKGCRVRQGLIFRSAHFPGPLNDTTRRLTDAQIHFWTNTVGLKTDLDLRGSDAEPTLGPSVNWIHNSYPYYANAVGSPATLSAFKVFADSANYPIDFHCAGGKDRTGTLAFFLSGLLGVSRDDLYRDFETTWLSLPDTPIGEYYARFKAIENGLLAYPGATLREKIENHFLQLGVTSQEIETFRAIMLEGYEPREDPVDPPVHEHEWNDWVTNAVPQIGVAGERQRTCTGCDKVEVETLDPLPDPGPGPGPDPEPVDPEPMGADWGWSNRVTVAGRDYCVLAFTNTAASGFAWTVPSGVTAIDYLVVGGGAGGGANKGGGGGAGFATNGTAAVEAGGSVSVRVGAGGAGATYVRDGAIVPGENGKDSSLAFGTLSITAQGGGGGGTYNRPGESGGCGGGGGSSGKQVGGAGSQGWCGYKAASSYGGGGGGVTDGGAAPGAASGTVQQQAGGPGLECSITGETLTYGAGGAGNKGSLGTVDPVAGADGTGYGGGAGEGAMSGFNGGSGIVIIRYAVADGPVPQKDPVVPGGEPKTYPTEGAAKAAAPDKVTPSKDVAKALAANPSACEAYIACFTVVTRQDAAGQWVNEAVLTAAAEVELREQVDADAVRILSSLADETLTLSPVTPGFYYALEFGETIGDMKRQSAGLATDAGGLTLPLPKGATSGFYRVVAGEAAR